MIQFDSSSLKSVPNAFLFAALIKIGFVSINMIFLKFLKHFLSVLGFKTHNSLSPS